jgi:hypothetical protein
MKLIFVAGPFRAKTGWEIEQNVRRAEQLALEVWRSGYAAICPHANTRFFHGVLPDEVWLRGIKEILRRCDGLILVEEWKSSKGTRAEIKLARALKIPVFNSIKDLIAWEIWEILI